MAYLTQGDDSTDPSTIEIEAQTVVLEEIRDEQLAQGQVQDSELSAAQSTATNTATTATNVATGNTLQTANNTLQTANNTEQLAQGVVQDSELAEQLAQGIVQDTLEDLLTQILIQLKILTVHQEKASDEIFTEEDITL